MLKLSSCSNFSHWLTNQNTIKRRHSGKRSNIYIYDFCIIQHDNIRFANHHHKRNKEIQTCFTLRSRISNIMKILLLVLLVSPNMTPTTNAVSENSPSTRFEWEWSVSASPGRSQNNSEVKRRIWTRFEDGDVRDDPVPLVPGLGDGGRCEGRLRKKRSEKEMIEKVP